MKNSKRIKNKWKMLMLYRKGHIFRFQNIDYSPLDWYHQTTDLLQFDEKRFKPKIKALNLSIRYLRTLFFYNVLKSTFSALILPCIVFSILSLIVFLVQLSYHYTGNFAFAMENESMRVFYLFLGIIFAVFAIILAIKVLFLKDKCTYGREHGNKGYHVLSKAEYNRRIELLNNAEENDYTAFKMIETGRLRVRELTELDAYDYYQMASSANVARFMGWKPHTTLQESIDLLAQVRGEYKNNLQYRLAIALRTNDQVIGYIGLSRYDLSATTCQVVYALNEAYWGAGYVKEALEAYLKALQASGKTTIYAGHVAENVASGKVLLKCGFVRDPGRDHKMMIHDEEKNITRYILEERKENT